ncbi:hypothetical protein [Ichthyenterobacterium magnum]|uniref:Uncharacterized protein n=1 Tax=Ichthyenterobacterium magnum TaxID=1230530 RepID=A0A420DG20_9FLAO|nr:hypothetical protein [Ichthyenterobacterium magnum]RKE92009.1 hypothetical protein BXY80_2441 [Ichthyenterobacterium magnum]
MRNILLLMLVTFLFNCNETIETKKEYKNQIGDTSFNPNLDNPKFKFCDSTKVLHNRSRISYTGGERALESELLKRFKFKPEYKSFNGYFIIRFAVNCKNETGRFRMQILDSNFSLTECPKELEEHILAITKELKHWNHAVLEGKDYDCYRFISIKLINGKVQKS